MSTTKTFGDSGRVTSMDVDSTVPLMDISDIHQNKVAPGKRYSQACNSAAVTATMATVSVLLFLLGTMLLGRPFEDKCPTGQAHICGYIACLTPAQGFGVFLCFISLPTALLSFGLYPQFLTSLYHRNGGSLTLNQILLGLFGFALAFVVLIVIVLVYLLKPWAIQPYGPNDSEGGPGHGANHYDALQLFFGGWAFLILLGFLTVYVVVAAKLHQRVFAPRRHNDIPKVPLEAKEPLYFCARLTILLLVLLGAFFFTMAFPAAFYRTGESFWKNPSPFAVTNWKMSASFVAKTYGDTLAFYMVLIALAVLGAGAHLVPRVKRVLHSRIRVPGVGFKYHPYPHGITCGEFVCIAAVVFLYVFWFWYFRWGYDRIVKGSAGDPHLSAQVWARVFGNISSLSFALVLFPAARNSMWVSCFGVPFERAIKHHRALGVVAYLSVTVHMCIWLGKWGVEGTLGNNLTNAHGLQVAPTHFIDAAKCEGMHPHYDNFTIIPSWVGWVLLTGMVAIAGLLRRKNYELFYYTHHFAWVYYIIALLHAWGMWMYVVGSVALYALDRWIRLTRGCVYGGAVKLSHRDGVTLIRFAHSPFGYLAGQYVFVNVPAISLTQWHPFTISSPPTQPGVEFELTVHAKDMGKGTWTHSLAELAKTSTTVEVKLDGPYGKPAPFTDRSVLILVAGGIGVTPMHALFADIYNRAVLGSGTDSITSVKLIWSGRSDDLFCMFGSVFHDVHVKNPKNMFSVHLHNSAPGLEELALKRSRGSSAESAAVDEYVRTIIHRGRPKIRQILAEVCGHTSPSQVMVMACGPEPMVDDASEAAFEFGCGFHSEVFAF